MSTATSSTAQKGQIKTATQTGQVKKTARTQYYNTFTKDCALLVGGFDGPIVASGLTMGLKHKVKARLVSYRPVDESPWMGFCLEFSSGEGQEANEESGFGVRHKCKLSTSSYVHPVDALLTNLQTIAG